MPGTIAALWPQVHEAFQSVDCILHAGDLHVASVIDELESIAPTYVCVGNGDLDVVHPKLKPSWLGVLANTSIGMIHKFPTPRRADEARLEKHVSRHFDGESPEIVVYGHTHLAEVHKVGARIYVNPGSATLPNNQSTRLGTIGYITIDPQGIEVALHQLTDNGLAVMESNRYESITT